ncbi:MAG: InlB B-repeat-containing protein [Clostridia bacterium]|nr:InlB B-repeat-containing protein [Clostridia bacterium]
MNLFKRLTAILCAVVLCFGLCPRLAIADGALDTPATAPLFSTYKEMVGVALDSRVAGKASGSKYIGYWEDTAYTFRVGIDVFADFESAYAALEGEKNIFVLTGHHGDLLITKPVNLYGYYYNVNPNQPHGEALGCPTLNQVRQSDRESCFDNVTVDAGVIGDVNLKGVVLRGGFYDINRAISAEPTNILLENIIVRQEAGIPSGGTQVFRFDNSNSKNSDKSAANNKDSAKVLNCRVEQLAVSRLFCNYIPPRFTVDGLVTVSGCTPFFGFPQWRRYMSDAEFTLQNCHFEDFVSPEGKKYFIVMEGLNKFNGNCTINIKDNVFTGDAASHMVEVYTKVGYDINITGNSFLAKTQTGLEPFKWNTTYDTTLYDDYAANADVSDTDLSAIVEISKNRFIGYTKFSNTVNDLTAFNIADNFFTNDLKEFESVLGGFPTKSAGWNALSYWVDFDFTIYGNTVPALVFTSHEVINGAAAKIIYTTDSTINLYDYGMTLPKGVKFTISGGESATAISVANGSVRTVQIKVYSYDGTRSATTSLMIYGRASYADAVAALEEAMIRINSGCYTAASLSAYQTAATLLQNALSTNSDPSEYITSLETAEANLAFKSGAEAAMKYFDYFPTLKKFKIVDAIDWAKFSATIVDTVSLSGYTIRLANDIDFGGATIKPVGGCYANSADSGNFSFNGTFDGGGYELSNFVIKEEAYGVGLFGKLYRATVKNLRIGSGSITGIDKVGGVAGYADASSKIMNCTNEASIIATDGSNGIGGIVSQARGGTQIIGCINYGSVTATNGRSCGIAAWGQSAAVLKYCINYGALSAPLTFPLCVYTTDFDASALVTGCYYSSGTSLWGEPISKLSDINEFAWLSGLKTYNGELTAAYYGCKIYRAALTCTNNGQTYYYYGAANTQIGFDIPGYVVDTVTYSGAVRPLEGLLITKDCTMTAEAIRVTYNITYNLDGGTLPTDAPQTYVSDVETSLPDIGSVKKNNYVFYGWYDNAALSGDPIYSIPAATDGDRTFYAKYLPIDRTITTAAQLVTFANAVNSGTNFAGKAVVIGANINLSGTTYPVIGNTLNTPFKGVLYGGGYQIKNLSVSSKPLSGLVGVLGAGGAVASLQVQGTVSGSVAGGIVANNIGGRVVACSFDGKVTSTATEIRVISQNLRVNSSEDPYLVSERHTPMKNILLSQKPDIIGFQEAERNWYSYLPSDFSEYSYVWTWRGVGSNNTTAGFEATPIFYKKSKFNLLDNGHFWISDTPNVPSYSYNNDSMNRICMWVKLQVKTTGEVLYFFNTHTSGEQTGYGTKGAELILKKIKEIVPANVPVYITADWNFAPVTASYALMTEYLDDAALVTQEDGTGGCGTTSNWGVGEPGRRIDMCFLRGDRITVPYYKVIRDLYTADGSQWYPSDHYGIFVQSLLESMSGGIVGKNEGMIQNCIATNDGTAAVCGGTLVGVNKGTVNKSALYSGTAVGNEQGSSNVVAVSDVENAVYTLNSANYYATWAVSNGALVLQPNGTRLLNVSYYDRDGKLLKTDLTSLEEAVKWVPSIDTEAEVFASWKQEIGINDATFTAVMTPTTFTVTFVDPEGEVLKEQTVDYGKAATPPSVTPPSGYLFAGWSGVYENVTADVTVEAIFMISDRFLVTLQAEGDASAMQANGQTVAAGDSFFCSVGDSVLLQAGEGFLYWKDDSGKMLSEQPCYRYTPSRNVTVTAVYSTADRVTVTFVGHDNTILKTQVLRTGRNGIAPAIPTVSGMTFSAWTESFKPAAADVVTRAIYLPSDTMLSVTVEGGTASAASVAYGETVTVTANVENFVGWSLNGKDIISEDRVYTLAVRCDITLTALTSAAAAYAPVSLSVDAEGNATLIRQVQGDYTVLGSGILTANALNRVIRIECIDGESVFAIGDTRLTRNGVMTVSVSATYLRGYVVLLNELTGEVETFYTSVIML